MPNKSLSSLALPSLTLLIAAIFAVPTVAQSSSRGLPSVAPGPIYLQPARPSDFGPVQAQGSSTPPGNRVMTSQPMAASRAASRALTFEQKLWGYLVRAKYRNWAPVPGNSDAMYEGQSPHGAFLKMYLNRRAAGNAKSLPDGSIIIKENFTPEKALAAVTVMYKTKGYNPAAGDWYWVKYNPNGSVAQKPAPDRTRLAGRVTGCIECHGGADGGDFAFFND